MTLYRKVKISNLLRSAELILISWLQGSSSSCYNKLLLRSNFNVLYFIINGKKRLVVDCTAGVTHTQSKAKT